MLSRLQIGVGYKPDYSLDRRFLAYHTKFGEKFSLDYKGLYIGTLDIHTKPKKKKCGYYSNNSFINVYLGYSLKQKLVPWLYTQNQNKIWILLKQQFYKCVPWIFTQAKIGTLVIHTKPKKSIIILVP